MDTGTLNGIITAALIVAFIGAWIWAFSAKRKTDFEEASRLPLEDDSPEKD
ncbi:MAG: cbb3-type cytochrome oxidase subunit 3 [Lysobacteraceae bacterium]|jgi:cytochrome c oxidase cbb3-type subunit 4